MTMEILLGLFRWKPVEEGYSGVNQYCQSPFFSLSSQPTARLTSSRRSLTVLAGNKRRKGGKGRVAKKQGN